MTIHSSPIKNGTTTAAWKEVVAKYQHPKLRRSLWQLVNTLIPYGALWYALAPHAGRGGWTWYTGSAGWMYRLLLETLLGLHLEGDRHRLAPRFPKTWTACTIHYRYRRTQYHIIVTRGLPADSSSLNQVIFDGQELPGETIPLFDDCRDHSVEIKTGQPKGEVLLLALKPPNERQTSWATSPPKQ